MSTQTTLKGFSNYGQPLLSCQLEANLVFFLQWGLLGKGAFDNVSLNESGAYGGDKSKLRLVELDSSNSQYTKGQVWEAFRQDWIYETGVEYETQPIRVSGVYVGGIFRPTSGVGPYAHHINYPLGRVIFDSPISITSTVKCEYSYRFVHVTTSDVPWWKRIHFNSLRPDDREFTMYASGAWSVLAENRVQLPAVVVEVLPRWTGYGKELGSSQRTTEKDVFFHILTEDAFNRKQLTDILAYQTEKTIIGFDLDRIYGENKLPLDSEGTPVANFLTYPQFIKPSGEGGYGWKPITFKHMQGEIQKTNLPFYHTIVRGVFEVGVPY